jgi:hypothetical protein
VGLRVPQTKLKEAILDITLSIKIKIKTVIKTVMCFCSINQSATLKSAFYPPQWDFLGFPFAVASIYMVGLLVASTT